MKTTKVLAIVGSTRRESYNQKLLSLAADRAQDLGVSVTTVQLRDLNIPLYDGDREEADGVPEGAQQLFRLMASHEAILFASPEYNGSVSGVLKNAIDWVSRPQQGEPQLAALQGKVAGLMSASPGSLGGFHGLVHLRDILGYIGMLVLPEQVAVRNAHEAFAEDGSLRDKRTSSMLDALVEKLAFATARLQNNSGAES
ncbi:MAG: NAD(P)H-dependent oxidoreductase [Planctomycetota bacterium]